MEHHGRCWPHNVVHCRLLAGLHARFMYPQCLCRCLTDHAIIAAVHCFPVMPWGWGGGATSCASVQLRVGCAGCLVAEVTHCGAPWQVLALHFPAQQACISCWLGPSYYSALHICCQTVIAAVQFLSPHGYCGWGGWVLSCASVQLLVGRAGGTLCRLSLMSHQSSGELYDRCRPHTSAWQSWSGLPLSSHLHCCPQVHACAFCSFSCVQCLLRT
jgi:hypothetical protein